MWIFSTMHAGKAAATLNREKQMKHLNVTIVGGCSFILLHYEQQKRKKKKSRKVKHFHLA